MTPLKLRQQNYLHKHHYDPTFAENTLSITNVLNFIQKPNNSEALRHNDCISTFWTLEIIYRHGPSFQNYFKETTKFSNTFRYI